MFIQTDSFAKRAAALVCALFSLFLAACGAAGAESAPVPSFPPLPEARGLRIAVASDLHFNPDDRPSGDEPRQSSYNMELADALLWDVKRQGAQLLLLTGDLCNGGRLHRHEGLTEKLRAAKEDGLVVCVVPGNHDLAPVTQTEFASLYAEFGYADAYSRDPVSLSYCVLYGDLMLLMMDTAGYGAAPVDLPQTADTVSAGPFFSDSTLLWVRAMLDEAEARGLHVLCAGHYNLLPEISRDPTAEGYYLRNGERFAALLRAAKVPLYCSGHMHTRAVYQEDGLTELLTEYLLAYPTAYSVLDLDEDGIVYTPRRIDVDGWAAESGQTDERLLHFARWQQDGLRAYSSENVAYMSARNPLSAREKKQAADFFYHVMDAYWRGALSEERDELAALPGRDAFFRCAEGYAYGWWLKSLMETASPLLNGFAIDW